jgi:hypothetical protein
MAEDTRIVLGAANIHTRFGYNSAWLILCAMFSLPGRPLDGAIGLNGVICFLVMSGMVQRVGAGVGRSGSSPSAVFAGASVLLIALAKLLPHNIGGPSTDLPAGLLTVYTFLLMLVLIEEAPAHRLEDRSLGTLLIAFPIGALAIICKSSQLPVALAVVFVAAAIGSWRHTSGRRVVCVGAASAAILATAWVLHGLALSGCLFYPVSRSCVAILPWTIPSTMADHDLAWITSFARIPTVKDGLVPDDWHWLPVWLHEIRGERLVVALKAVFGLCLLSGAIRLGAGRQVRCLGETLDSAGNKAALGLIAIATLGLGYWFFAAPALRFGYGFLLAQPLLILCLVIPVPRDRPSPRFMRHVAPGFAVIALCLALGTIANLPAETLLSSDRPEIPMVEVMEQRTANGEWYFSPKIGDSCWASPRFCTPVPSPGLAFEQLGPWRMAVATPR